jgi:hypothetical protein
LEAGNKKIAFFIVFGQIKYATLLLYGGLSPAQEKWENKRGGEKRLFRERGERVYVTSLDM